MKRFALIPLFALALPAAAQVAVAEAWVRATVPSQQATGAFMQLTATHDTRLVAAASPVARIVEVHEMRMDGGVMTMRQLADGLPLPAGKAVALKPGGYHVMLMDLKQQIKVGDSVPLTLTFEDAAKQRTSIEVTAPAKPLGGAGH